MKKASLVVSKPYLANAIFDRTNKNLNRDDCLAAFFYLRETFKMHGYDLSTQDINSIKKSDIVIYNDMPKKLPECDKISKSFLLILESPLIVKNSWKQERLKYFKKVFTWNDDYIDGKKFIKVNYSYDFQHQGILKTHKNKLLCMISANKSSNEENELYSERENVIRFFEKKYPKEFDLYGIGWDKVRLNGIFKIFKKIPYIWNRIPFTTYSSYRGSVANKKEVMSKYKFAICYENVRDLNGYITEKIFDCFFSGTVPIYWGASNITDYIPKDCFVDRRQFKTNEELYEHIINISDEEYITIIKNIEKYLNKQTDGNFSCNMFSKIVCDSIMEKE